MTAEQSGEAVFFIHNEVHAQFNRKARSSNVDE